MRGFSRRPEQPHVVTIRRLVALAIANPEFPLATGTAFYRASKASVPDWKLEERL